MIHKNILSSKIVFILFSLFHISTSHALTLKEICDWSSYHDNSVIFTDTIYKKRCIYSIPHDNGDLLIKKAIKIIRKDCEEIHKQVYKDWSLESKLEIKTYYKDKYLSFTTYKYTENEQTGYSDISIKNYTLYRQDSKIFLYEIVGTPAFINYIRHVMPDVYDVDCMNEFTQCDKYGFYVYKGSVYINPINSKVCTESLQFDPQKIVKLSIREI